MGRFNKRTIYLILSSSLSLFMLFSCKTMADKEKVANLEPAVLQYYEQVTWFRGNIAKNFVIPSKRPDFLDRMDLASKKIKISEIKVIRISPSSDKKNAKVRLRVIWFSRDSNIVNETLVEDKWLSVKSAWFKDSSKIVDGKKIPYLFVK